MTMSEPIQQPASGEAPQHGAPPPPRSAPPAAHGPGQYPAARDPREKSPFLAGLLSAMPGLGQVYVGYYQRGFVHAVVVATLISLLAAEALGPLTPLASVFMAFFWLYNMVDAARRAALYNQALAGVGNVELPDDFKAPTFRGSVAGGLAIAAAGVVLLLHTRFGLSLEWVEEWWPAALILAGAYLVWKAWQERAEDSGPVPDGREAE